jgi:hypothetical protein
MKTKGSLDNQLQKNTLSLQKNLMKSMREKGFFFREKNSSKKFYIERSSLIKIKYIELDKLP